ncbi:hypothetical protein MRX96_037066 [Rhipicephalus microplus]
MGLQGAELKTWVDARLERAHEESVQAREERSAERQAAKERLEIEERTLQLRFRLAEVEGAHLEFDEITEAEKEFKRPPTSVSAELLRYTCSYSKSRLQQSKSAVWFEDTPVCHNEDLHSLHFAGDSQRSTLRKCRGRTAPAPSSLP